MYGDRRLFRQIKRVLTWFLNYFVVDGYIFVRFRVIAFGGCCSIPCKEGVIDGWVGRVCAFCFNSQFFGLETGCRAVVSEYKL